LSPRAIIEFGAQNLISRRRKVRGRVLSAIYSLLVVAVPITFLLVSCGGGGSGGSSSATGSSGTGSVVLLLADGPADDYEEIWVTITEVLLIPSEDSERDKVVIFRNPDGVTVDLLELRDEDFLLTVKKRVPAGKYEKIRLVISDIEPVGEPCSSFKVGSRKIDLNPRESFKVVKGETLSIRLDVDANKSINISTSCNFRPVVFVDIEPGAPIRPCPRILSGTILRLVKRHGITVGFVLDLEKRRGELDVRVTDDTAIFDENGEFGGRELLERGQQVKVRGRLDDDGKLMASVVVIGQVLVVKGEVDGPLDDATGLFPFTPFPGDQRDVAVADETLILIGCDTEVGKGAIQAGMTAKVVGKEDEEGVLRSVLILLQAREVSGEIILIEDDLGGKTVTVEQETGAEVEVFIPKGTPINIEGDGSVPMELFCEGRQVRIFLDPDILDPLTATLVLVQAERRVGEVIGDPDEFDRTLTVGAESVSVQLGATILDTRGADDTLVGFEVISDGDQLEYFGLDACPGDTGFTAFVILITG
jgi:hypothetical protein